MSEEALPINLCWCGHGESQLPDNRCLTPVIFQKVHWISGQKENVDNTYLR